MLPKISKYVAGTYRQHMFSFDIGAMMGGFATTSANYENMNMQRQENKVNREFADYQATKAYKRQIDLMDKEMLWNSPVNQARLLREAGINPAILGSQGGSTVGRSNGASPVAQANTPNTRAPQMVLDPQMITALAQANLMGSEADKNRKEIDLMGHQITGQDLINEAQRIANDLETKYGDLSRQMNIDLQDSQRALNDASRHLQNTLHSLNIDELFKQRPAQMAKTYADAYVSSTQGILNEMVTAKTEKEKEHIAKYYALQVAIGASTIANQYANAFNQNSQAFRNMQDYNHWSNGGLFYNNTQANTNLLNTQDNSLSFDFHKKQEFHNRTFDAICNQIVSDAKLKANLNEKDLWYLNTWIGKASYYINGVQQVYPDQKIQGPFGIGFEQKQPDKMYGYPSR